MVGKCPLYEKERYTDVSKLGMIEGCERETFETWDWEKKAIAVLGDTNWFE